MPFRINQNLERMEDLFVHSISPSIFHATLFAGASTLTSISPASALLAGGLIPYTDYVLDKLARLCFGAGHDLEKYAITRLSSYAIATAATAALGFPSISFFQAVFLSIGSQCAFVAVAAIVTVIVAQRSTLFNRYGFITENIRPVGRTFGLPFVAIATCLGAEFIGASILGDPTFRDPRDLENEANGS